MIEILKTLILQLNSAVFILLILLVLALILTFKLGGWISNFRHDKNRLDKFEEKTEKFIEMSTKLDLIYHIVNPNLATKNFSPLVLTEKGEKMQKDINANIIFNRIVESEKASILQSHHEHNAYDIQMACVEWSKNKVSSLLTPEELVSTKKVAFDNDILLEDVLAILGIMMRDDILQELGIPIVNVDTHTPDK